MRTAIFAALLSALLAALAANSQPVARAPVLGHQPEIHLESGDRFAFRLSASLEFRGITEFRGTEPRSWTGRLERAAGTFTVVEHAGRRFAVIQLPERTYEVIARGRRDPLTVRVIEHQSLPRYCGVGQAGAGAVSATPATTCPTEDDRCDLAKQAMKIASMSSSYEDPCSQAAEPANDPPPEISVAVAYTPAVRSAYGEFGVAIRSLIAIAQTNAAFHLSEITARAKLARRGCIFRRQPCVREVDYDESGRSISYDLKQVLCRDPGCLGAVRELRDKCKADVAILLVNESCDFHGEACVMKTLTPAYGDFAMAVVHAESATATLTFTHELGHLMGGGHENSAGLCDDSKGYLFTTGISTHTTIMHREAMFRTLYFSNPVVTYEGTAQSVGAQNENNAKTIRISAGTVAQFR